MATLTVNGECNNFLRDGKVVWYRAVPTTDQAAIDSIDDKITAGVSCTNNETPSKDRCYTWAKSVECAEMATKQNYINGLYGLRRRLSSDPPESNLCASTCLDVGDVFCVNKNDLQSDPVCCPKECAGDDGVNQCAKSLSALNHVCSDSFVNSDKARDEFKYMLCPREGMDEQCGTKITRFDLDKDNNKVFTFAAPRVLTTVGGSTTADFKFKAQSICNYVFIMPEGAAPGVSGFEIAFRGTDEAKNSNTQAYVARVLTDKNYGSGDDVLPLGEILKGYDGEWERVIPGTAKRKDEPWRFVQRRDGHDQDKVKYFLENDELTTLNAGGVN